MLLQTADKYLSIMTVSIRNTFAYSWEIAYRSTFMLLILYVFVQLWGSVYAGKTSIAGYTLPQTIWYFVITESILMSKLAVGNVISDDVISGKLAYTMGRPYHYMLYNFYNGLGESVIRLLINLLGGSVLVFLFVGPISIHWWVIFPLLITILFALVLDFCMMALVALLAFFTEDVSGFFFIYQKVMFILGGLLIPIDFFPNWLRSFTNALPFDLVLYAPAKLFVSFSVGAFGKVICQQVIWIVVLGFLLEMMYRLGCRKVSVNGG